MNFNIPNYIVKVLGSERKLKELVDRRDRHLIELIQSGQLMRLLNRRDSILIQVESIANADIRKIFQNIRNTQLYLNSKTSRSLTGNYIKRGMSSLFPTVGMTPNEYRAWLLSKVRERDPVITRALLNKGKVEEAMRHIGERYGLQSPGLEFSMYRRTYREYMDVLSEARNYAQRMEVSPIKHRSMSEWNKRFMGLLQLKEGTSPYPRNTPRRTTPAITYEPTPIQAKLSSTPPPTQVKPPNTSLLAQKLRTISSTPKGASLKMVSELVRKGQHIDPEELRRILRLYGITLPNNVDPSNFIKKSTTDARHLPSIKFSGNAVMPVGIHKGKTLSELPPVYLVQVAQQVSQFLVKYPRFGRELAFAIQQPWYQAIERRFMGDPHNTPNQDRYSPRDSQIKFSQYRPETWNRDFGPRRRHKDMWLGGKGVVYPGDQPEHYYQPKDLHGNVLPVEGYSMFMRPPTARSPGNLPIGVTYLPHGDPIQMTLPFEGESYPYDPIPTPTFGVEKGFVNIRERNKVTRKRRTYDPEAGLSERRRELWDMMGGVPIITETTRRSRRTGELYETTQFGIAGQFRETYIDEDTGVRKWRFGGMRGVIDREVEELERLGLRKQARDVRAAMVEEYYFKTLPLIEQMERGEKLMESLSRGHPFYPKEGRGDRKIETEGIERSYTAEYLSREAEKILQGRKVGDLSKREFQALQDLGELSSKEFAALDELSGMGFRKRKKIRGKREVGELEDIGEVGMPAETAREIFENINRIEDKEKLEQYWLTINEKFPYTPDAIQEEFLKRRNVLVPQGTKNI